MKDEFDAIFAKGAEAKEDYSEAEENQADDPAKAESQPEEVATEEEVKSPEAVKEVEQKEKEGTKVPLDALLEERAKRQEIAKELDELRKAQATQAAKPKSNHPDPIDDPEGFRAAILMEAQQFAIKDRFARNHEEAVEKHGQDKVQTASEWARDKALIDKAFEAKVMTASRPIDLIVREHERAAQLAEFETMDRREFVLKQAAELGINLAPETQVSSEETKPDVVKTQSPKSLVNATSVGSNVKQSERSFDDIFNMKR